MGEIIWLASYPKSGNTWFRAFLSNLLSEEGDTVDINHLETDGIASNRILFDEMTGIDSEDMTMDEIDALRPEVYEYIAEALTKTSFVKIHDAYTHLTDGRPLIPSYKAKAIYIVRNPLDVAVSFSYHNNSSLDKTIDNMAKDDFCFCSRPIKFHTQLRQKLLSWSGHVDSWFDNNGIPVHVIRYEDMKNKPFETFKKAVEFIGLLCDDEKIKNALELSQFERLKAQEEKTGFREKPTNMNAFFREGKTGGWRDHLSEEQVSRILEKHKRVMKNLGYIDENNNIVF
ncbi:MAG: sulfotransferase domain-containing protein [Desulfosporosinus sp.]|nr:sulfotransferase domain-containing protein [Desulfosporosinus sp.]